MANTMMICKCDLATGCGVDNNEKKILWRYQKTAK